MKIRVLLVTLTCALVSLPSVQAQAPATAPKRDFNTPIGDAMDKMRTAFGGLRDQLGDSTKNADSLTKIAALKAAAMEAVKHEPVRAQDVPAEEKAKFVADFKADMQKAIDLAGKLETALKANNNAEAQKAFDELGAAQKAGHTAYKKKKKKAA